MLKAIEDIVSNESFHVKLEPAMTARRQAVDILRWARDNERTFGRFETAVRAELQRCIYQGAVEPKSFQSENRHDMKIPRSSDV